MKELEELGVIIHIDEDSSKYLDDSFDYVVKNPGISNENELVKKAEGFGIPVINEVELAYHFCQKLN